MIPNDAGLKLHPLQTYHNSHLGGHVGSLWTYIRLAGQFNWRDIHQDVQAHIQQCLICLQAKHFTTAPVGMLQPLSIPTHIWEDISMDFVCGLLLSKGYSVIFVVIDRLSKYGYFVPLKYDFSSTSVAKVFIKVMFKLHGLSKSL